MSGGESKPSIVFAVTNCICHDQRVLKMAGTVETLGTSVTIVGRKRGKCCETETVGFRTRRFNMLFRRGFLFYCFFNIRLFFYLLFSRCDIIVSNDLDTLLPSFLVARLRSKILVFDSHEYFTGVPELADRPFVRGVWRLIEQSIFPHLRNVVTVSDSIADQYFNDYGKKPVVIRNCSRRSDSILPYSREELGLKSGGLLLIYQGGGINIQRGGAELLLAMKECTDDMLLIIGEGDVIVDLKNIAANEGLSEKVRFFPAMPWEEMMRFTRSADAGLSLDKNTSLNYRFSLPNKLFDYISAGIPVIAGDLPEVSRIITENSCGIIIPAIEPGEIVQAIRLIDGNRDLLRVMRQNAKEAAVELNWDNEAVKVKELYLNLLAQIK